MPLQELLERFDRRNDSFRETQIYAELGALSEASATSLANDLAWELMAFLFREDYPDNDTGWGTYFGPMTVLRDEAGQVIERPSISHVTAETLTYWTRRCAETKHPLIRMRYADLVWDLGSKIPSVIRNATCARIAIDAALELVARPETVHIMGRKKLSRALQLAHALRDEACVVLVCDAMIRFEERTATDEHAGSWGYCFDELIETKEQLAPGQEDRIIIALEDRLQRLVRDDGPNTGDPFGPRDAAVRLARYYRRKQRKDDVRRVLRSCASVFELLARGAMPLVGGEWMREVYDTYREFELNEDADALNPILAELGIKAKQNMRHITREFTVPPEHFERLRVAVLSETMVDSLTNIARIFLVDPEQVEREVKALSLNAPLYSLLRQVHLDSYGRVESEIGGVQEDLRGRVIAHVANITGLQAVELRFGMDTICERFSVCALDLTDALCMSPLFTFERRSLIERAMRAFLEHDPMAFAHLLIPQIEHAIRTLVIMRGGSHLAPDRRRGGLKYRTLDELLRDSTVGEVLGAKVVQYLLVVLTDARGLNLRNGICHGFIPPEMFNQQMADRLFHVALLLAQLRVKPERDAAPGSTQ